MKRSSSAPNVSNFADKFSKFSSPSGSSAIKLPPRRDLLKKPAAAAAAVLHHKISLTTAFHYPTTLCSPVVEKNLNRLLKEDDSSVKNCVENDYANERFFRCSSMVSHFSLDSAQSTSAEQRKRTKSVCEPVHCIINNNNAFFNSLTACQMTASCSPSPSRSNDKQCYSPSMRKVVHNAYHLSPSPSPSPTRRHSSFLRSLSPIAVRNVNLGVKRKLDEDDADNSSDGASCSSFVGKRPNLAAATTSKLASFSSPRILESTTNSDCSADNNVVEMMDDF